MSEARKDFHVTVMLRNNQLLDRRNAAGLSQRELMDALGVPVSRVSHYSALETMRYSPINSKGEWSPMVVSLSKFWRVLPEDLFPEAILEIEKRKAEALFNRCELAQFQLAEPTIEALPSPEDVAVSGEIIGAMYDGIETLPERQAIIVQMRFGVGGYEEHTYAAIAKRFNLTTERVRQIEQGGLRKLRHPGVCRQIRDAVGAPAKKKKRPPVSRHPTWDAP